jgi:hypothetical protein
LAVSHRFGIGPLKFVSGCGSWLWTYRTAEFSTKPSSPPSQGRLSQPKKGVSLMSLSSAKNYALRAARSQDEKEAIELLSKAILELAASIEDTDGKLKRINKSRD